MREIAKALLSGDIAEREIVINLEVLRYAVQREIFCFRTGAILDMRTAVLVTVVRGNTRSAYVVTGEAYDEIVASGLHETVAKISGSVEIIDGRALR